MMPKARTACVLAAVALLAASGGADAAKLRLGGKTPKEVEDEARRTGVVPRALRAKLLLKTVTGTLHSTDAAMEVAGMVTPVPGGTGPMTNIILMRNTLDAARRQLAR